MNIWPLFGYFGLSIFFVYRDISWTDWAIIMLFVSYIDISSAVGVKQ